MLSQFLVVSVELTELIRKDVSIWDEIKVVLSILFLHSDNVAAESVFSGHLVRLWEMINLLEFVKAFINVTLAG